jgi:hypothetical protein
MSVFIKDLLLSVALVCLLLAFTGLVQAAGIVPDETWKNPTQLEEFRHLESSDRCKNCASGFTPVAPVIEPVTGWRAGHRPQLSEHAVMQFIGNLLSG